MISIQVKDDPATSLVVIDNLEDEYSTQMAVAGGASGAPGYCRFSVDIQKFLGSSDRSEMKGDSGLNPLEQVYFHIVGYPIDATNSLDLELLVKITYDVDLMEPKNPASS